MELSETTVLYTTSQPIQVLKPGSDNRFFNTVNIRSAYEHDIMLKTHTA